MCATGVRVTCLDLPGRSREDVLQWAAFYTDCRHEVMAVSSGARVVLQFDLYAHASEDDMGPDEWHEWVAQKSRPCRALSVHEVPQHRTDPCALVSALRAHWEAAPHQRVGILLHHRYAGCSLLPEYLKGVDQVLLHMCFMAGHGRDAALRHCAQHGA